MQLVKLTHKDGTTQGGYLWEAGTTHTLPKKKNPELCSSSVFHVYPSAEVATFMRYTHEYSDCRAWLAEGEPVVSDGTKVGVFSLTILREIELPQPTLQQTVLFAMLCAADVLPDGAMDESIEATKRGDFAAAAYAAARAANAADAAYAATDAAYAATNAAYAATNAAYAAYAATDAAYAAYAATDAAYAARAANAAYAARAANFDLHAIARKALESSQKPA